MSPPPGTFKLRTMGNHERAPNCKTFCRRNFTFQNKPEGLKLSNNHATFIWSIADLLRGSFKAHQYGDIILPFTVLRRLDAVLAPTAKAVYAAVTDSFKKPLIASRSHNAVGAEMCKK